MTPGRHSALPIHLLRSPGQTECGLRAGITPAAPDRDGVTCPRCLHPLVAFILERLDHVPPVEIPVYRHLSVQTCSICAAAIVLSAVPQANTPYGVIDPNDHDVQVYWTSVPRIVVGCPMVRRDIEGKREIIDDHMAMHAVMRSSNRMLALVGEEQPDRACTCVPMRALALPWSDHKDYRPEWSLDA